MTSVVPGPSSPPKPDWTNTRNGTVIEKEANSKKNWLCCFITKPKNKNVPFGPCGYDALTAFSVAPSLVGYQVILVDSDRSFHITTFGHPQDKKLILLHEKGHYDVITRLPRFFGSSYCVLPVGNPITMQDFIDAPKQKGHCRACCQKECPDFFEAYPRGLNATRRSQHCHRDFFGDTCFQTHLANDHTGKPATNPQSTVCSRRRRCPNCFKQEVGDQAIQRHRCGYLNCPSCREYVDGPHPPRTEKKEKETPRRGGLRAKRGTAAGLQTLQANEVEEEGEDVDDAGPPLHVFFDIEAMQPWEEHIPNLVVAETEDYDRPVRFPGEHCIRDFLE